eukprot:6188099-Pleurochrysis_carterae.AAC.1
MSSARIEQYFQCKVMPVFCPRSASKQCTCLKMYFGTAEAQCTFFEHSRSFHSACGTGPDHVWSKGARRTSLHYEGVVRIILAGRTATATVRLLAPAMCAATAAT